MADKYRILITGGSGFIGTNLVEHYSRAGLPVCNLDSSPPRNPAHRHLWAQVDLLSSSEMKTALREFCPTHLFHLAARTDLNGNSIDDYLTNTVGVTILIDAAASVPDLRRILFASSRLVCRIGYRPAHARDYNPTTAYGASKVEGERRVYDADNLACQWAVIRPTSIWGPWFGTPYRNFFDAVRRGHYVHPRGACIRKSFGYVGNTVHQLDRLMFEDTMTINGRMFYLCDSPPIEVGEFARMIRNEFNAPPIHSAPLAMLRAAALAGDMLQACGIKNPPLSSFRLDNLLTEMLHDTSDLTAICGSNPHSVLRGISQTVEWMSASQVEVPR